MIDGIHPPAPDTAEVFGFPSTPRVEEDLWVRETPLRTRAAAFLGKAFGRMKDLLRAPEPVGYYMDDKFPSVPLAPLTPTEVENMLRGRSDLAEQ